VSAQYAPPETYQQWLACFEHLHLHPLDTQMLETLEKGRYLGQPTEVFLSRLSEAVSISITGFCRRFLRQFDIALADGEPDMAVLLATRLRRNIQKCFFYRALPFLGSAYIQTLDTGLREQLDFFWKNFLQELQRTARDTDSPIMEDLCYEMKRVTILY
jgi:hypothetical protein